MTRINLVPPQELMDQHLMAEWREIKMVPKALARSIRANGLDGMLQLIPPEFKLGAGHVTFFYDKGYYLKLRYNELTQELLRRGFKIDERAPLDPDGVYSVPMHINCRPLQEAWRARLYRDYRPTQAALALIRERIRQRIAEKPGFYRYCGLPIEEAAMEHAL
jgi:deoxyribonuclease (pyrimidine dimer)